MKRVKFWTQPETIWHTPWEPTVPSTAEIIIDLRSPQEIRGLTCLPRQDMTNGRIGKYEIYVSGDGRTGACGGGRRVAGLVLRCRRPLRTPCKASPLRKAGGPVGGGRPCVHLGAVRPGSLRLPVLPVYWYLAIMGPVVDRALFHPVAARNRDGVKI